MALYSQTQPRVAWIEPLELGWQLLGGQPATDLAPKLPHLGLADILFMSSVMHTPRERRPWGIVSWLADAFCLSRPALYALAQRVEERLTNPTVIAQLPAPVSSSTVTVTENRLIRTALTASLSGKAALRPTGEILQEAFGRKRSPAWLNELLRQAGVKAGDILRQVDTSPLQNVIVLRDETFLGMVCPLVKAALYNFLTADGRPQTAVREGSPSAVGRRRSNTKILHLLFTHLFSSLLPRICSKDVQSGV